MKLNETFKFAHPVLSEFSDDYVEGMFNLSISVSERPSSGQLEIDYRINLQPDSLLELLQRRVANLYVSVVCRQSFFNEMLRIEELGGQLEVKGGLLAGRVQIRAILSTACSGVFELKGINAEYPSEKVPLSGGAVLAWSDAQLITVGMDKLAPMESIFRLSLDEGIPEGKFGVALDQEFVSIRAPAKLLSTMAAMRGSALARPVILNSVYLPAVISVLDAIKADSGSYAEKRWYRVIRAKAELSGINLEAGDSLDQAQTLLKLPSGRLTRFMESIP